MKVYGYCRCSTDYEVKQGSLQLQEEKIKQHCQLQGHELIEIFKDAGISAVDFRPDFEKMMTKIRKGDKADAVTVSKLDRFGRSVKELVLTIDELQKLNVQFISIGDNIDTSTPNGKLLFHILSAFAEFEREIIRERMQAGREKAIREGKLMHRPKKKINLKELKELYCDKKLSVRSCAKYYQTSPATISARLKEIGVYII